MNIITISIGTIIAVFGLYTFYVRIKTPEKLGKLQAMKEKFGSRVGTAIHTIAYSVIPLILGGTVMIAGVKGITIMQFIAS